MVLQNATNGKADDRQGLLNGALVAEAMRYRRLGWSVVPLAPGTKFPPEGFRLERCAVQRPRQRDIERWFRRDFGIAVVLGEVSGGLCCRDFDDLAAYDRWAAQFPALATSLPTTRTARGRGVFWRTDGDDASVAGLACVLPAEDGELRLGIHAGLRGRGKVAMAVLPPSRHPDGPIYEWITPPWHGVPMIHNAGAAGLIPANDDFGLPNSNHDDYGLASNSKSIFPVRAHGAYTHTVQTDIYRERDGSGQPPAGPASAGDGELALQVSDPAPAPARRPLKGRPGGPEEVGGPARVGGAGEGAISVGGRGPCFKSSAARAQHERDKSAPDREPAPDGPDLFDAKGDVSEAGFDHWLGWTVPTGRGQHDGGVFKLARQLKTLPETRGLQVWDLAPIVRRWWQLAVPAIREKDWLFTWGKFVSAFSRAFPFETGRVAMQHILERARRAGCPIDVPAEYRTHTCGLVATICRELAIDGGGQFFLDGRTLGRLLNVCHKTAATWLNALVGSRVIAVTKSHSKGRAREYRYLRSLPAPDVPGEKESA